MKTPSIKPIICGLAASSLLFSSTGIANAQSSESPETINVGTCSASDSQSQNDVSNAIKLINPYIKAEANQLVANIPESIKSQVKSEIFQSLMESLEHTNVLIREGKISAQSVDPRYGQVRDAGVTRVELHWWGVSLMLSNDVFVKALLMVGAGAGAAAVAGYILDAGGITLPAGLSLNALGGIIGASIAIMQPCNWNGKGVGLHHAWTGQSWCWPQ